MNNRRIKITNKSRYIPMEFETVLMDSELRHHTASPVAVLCGSVHQTSSSRAVPSTGRR
jgi:hypothetical protein